MLELYVLLTLGAIGYYVNKNSKEISEGEKNVINKNEKPSMRNIYDAEHFLEAEKITGEKAQCNFNNADDLGPKKIISKNYWFMKDLKDKPKEKILSLSGEYVNQDELKHNNMIPFYGSKIRQNTVDDRNRHILEKFTGVDDIHRVKHEVKSFTDKARNFGNPHGLENLDDKYLEHIVEPYLRNNEFPIQRTYVGPGINDGYTAKPKGGFHQFEAQEFAYRPNVDQLRTDFNCKQGGILYGATDKPKKTYAGETKPGTLPSGMPGIMTVPYKNRPFTYYDNTPNKWFTTTGSVIGPTKHGILNNKDTNRMTTNDMPVGTAYAKESLKTEAPSMYRSPFKKTYINQKNEQNVTTYVKQIIAPLLDVMRRSRKEYDTCQQRKFGNTSITFPHKATVYDPNQVARTTVKETLIHGETLGNPSSENPRTYAYDPEEYNAKTTIRDTLGHEKNDLNLAGTKMLTIYDPEDVAKTTIKEQYANLTREKGNIDAISDGNAYINTPWDARLTQKQFLSDYEHYNPADSSAKAHMSQKSAQNAEIFTDMEDVLPEREPTQVKEKHFQNYTNMKYPAQREHMDHNPRTTHNINQLHTETSRLGGGFEEGDKTVTKQRIINYEKDIRVDPMVLESLRSNPFYNIKAAEGEEWALPKPSDTENVPVWSPSH